MSYRDFDTVLKQVEFCRAVLCHAQEEPESAEDYILAVIECLDGLSDFCIARRSTVYGLERGEYLDEDE